MPPAVRLVEGSCRISDVDTKVLCDAMLSTVSGWEHSSTTQFERAPQGSFGVVTYRDTVSACTVNRNAQS